MRHYEISIWGISWSSRKEECVWRVLKTANMVLFNYIWGSRVFNPLMCLPCCQTLWTHQHSSLLCNILNTYSKIFTSSLIPSTTPTYLSTILNTPPHKAAIQIKYLRQPSSSTLKNLLMVLLYKTNLHT